MKFKKMDKSLHVIGTIVIVALIIVIAWGFIFHPA